MAVRARQRGHLGGEVASATKRGDAGREDSIYTDDAGVPEGQAAQAGHGLQGAMEAVLHGPLIAGVAVLMVHLGAQVQVADHGRVAWADLAQPVEAALQVPEIELIGAVEERGDLGAAQAVHSQENLAVLQLFEGDHALQFGQPRLGLDQSLDFVSRDDPVLVRHDQLVDHQANLRRQDEEGGYVLPLPGGLRGASPALGTEWLLPSHSNCFNLPSCWKIGQNRCVGSGNQGRLWHRRIRVVSRLRRAKSSTQEFTLLRLT